jgi:hypothetical protein
VTTRGGDLDLAGCWAGWDEEKYWAGNPWEQESVYGNWNERVGDRWEYIIYRGSLFPATTNSIKSGKMALSSECERERERERDR